MKTKAIFLEDISRLSKMDLQELCTQLNIDKTGIISDLALKIWNAPDKEKTEQIVFQYSKDKIFAGKKSITWYQFQDSLVFCNIKFQLKSKLGFDPFQETILIADEDLTAVPQIIAAVEMEEGKFYFRCAYKSGIEKLIIGDQYQTYIQKSMVTVYLEEGSNFIEVRGRDSKVSDNTVEMIASIFEKTITPQQLKVPYANDLGKMADLLKGSLIDAKSRVSAMAEELSLAERNAVFMSIEALGKYFEHNNLKELEANLSEVKDFITSPFMLMLLNGLNAVGVSGDNEIRGTVLYKWLEPYIEPQDGYIRFSLEENGMRKEYTIRIGIKKNSIFFTTPSSEKAIAYVRENLIFFQNK